MDYQTKNYIMFLYLHSCLEVTEIAKILGAQYRQVSKVIETMLNDKHREILGGKRAKNGQYKCLNIITILNEVFGFNELQISQIVGVSKERALQLIEESRTTRIDLNQTVDKFKNLPERDDDLVLQILQTAAKRHNTYDYKKSTDDDSENSFQMEDYVEEELKDQYSKEDVSLVIQQLKDGGLWFYANQITHRQSTEVDKINFDEWRSKLRKEERAERENPPGTIPSCIQRTKYIQELCNFPEEVIRKLKNGAIPDPKAFWKHLIEIIRMHNNLANKNQIICLKEIAHASRDLAFSWQFVCHIYKYPFDASRKYEGNSVKRALRDEIIKFECNQSPDDSIGKIANRISQNYPGIDNWEICPSLQYAVEAVKSPKSETER